MDHYLFSTEHFYMGPIQVTTFNSSKPRPMDNVSGEFEIKVKESKKEKLENVPLRTI